jgi:hypothetical protein
MKTLIFEELDFAAERLILKIGEIEIFAIMLIHREFSVCSRRPCLCEGYDMDEKCSEFLQ